MFVKTVPLHSNFIDWTIIKILHNTSAIRTRCSEMCDNYIHSNPSKNIFKDLSLVNIITSTINHKM